MTVSVAGAEKDSDIGHSGEYEQYAATYHHTIAGQSVAEQNHQNTDGEGAHSHQKQIASFHFRIAF